MKLALLSLLVISLCMLTTISQVGGSLRIPLTEHADPHRAHVTHLQKVRDEEQMRIQQSEVRGPQPNQVPIVDYRSTYMVANISVGTPPQPIPVVLKLHSTDTWVIGAEAYYDENSQNRKTLYHEGDSSTFVNATTSWSSYYGYVSGYVANDTLSIAGVQFPNTSVGAATILYASYYKSTPASGELGLMPKKQSSSSSSSSSSSNTLKSVLHQMLDNTSTPIVTLLMNRTMDYNAQGSGWLTIGEEDAVNCGSNYAYSPLYTSNGDWEFYMQTACAAGTCFTQTDTIVKVDEPYSNMYVTQGMMDFFVSISNATYDSRSGLYNVTCERSLLPIVSFTVGRSDTTQQLQVPPEAYTNYSSYNMCHLRMTSAYSNNYPRMDLGYHFLNHHCVALDLSRNMIGISPINRDAQAHIAVDDTSTVRLAGPISVGSPAQRIYVSFPMNSNDFWVIGSTADYVEWSRQRKTLYNEFGSRTMTNSTNAMSMYGGFVSGYTVSDMLDLSSSRANTSFGVATQLGSYLLWASYSGEFGISPNPTLADGRSPSPLYQLLSGLEKPVLSIYMNRTTICNVDPCPAGIGQLTLGDEDYSFCTYNYSYMPRVVHADVNAYSFGVSALNTTSSSLALPSFNAIINPNQPGITAHANVTEFISKVVNASYSQDSATYNLNSCDTSNFPNVTMTAADGLTVIPLYVEDYVMYESARDTCYLALKRDNSSPVVFQLGSIFLSSHCMAFNMVNNTIGFSSADAKLGLSPSLNSGESDSLSNES